jgi:uncharacterized membrane protein
MTFDPLVAIAVMAAVTYGLRMAGFALMARIKPSARVRRMFEALPGSVVAATVVPVAVAGGPSALAALLVAAGVMVATRKDVVAVVAGLATAALLRTVLG